MVQERLKDANEDDVADAESAEVFDANRTDNVVVADDYDEHLDYDVVWPEEKGLLRLVLKATKRIPLLGRLWWAE